MIKIDYNQPENFCCGTYIYQSRLGFKILLDHVSFLGL